MGTLSKASRRAAGKRRFLGLFGAWAPLALAFVLPLSGARAGEDCRSLDIHLDAAAGFTDITCDSLADSHADISDTREMIFAHDSRSVFVIRHLAAGNRTYLKLMAPKDLIESAFAKAEGWAAGPGGNGYAAVRFTGWRKVSPDLQLSCFGFARFTGHVDHSMGYRNAIYGYYCAKQPDAVSEAEAHRLLGAVTFSFE